MSFLFSSVLSIALSRLAKELLNLLRILKVRNMAFRHHLLFSKGPLFPQGSLNNEFIYFIFLCNIHRRKHIEACHCVDDGDFGLALGQTRV